jgi:hypothetical protein
MLVILRKGGDPTGGGRKEMGKALWHQEVEGIVASSTAAMPTR